jgi:hypothetical protein
MNAELLSDRQQRLKSRTKSAEFFCVRPVVARRRQAEWTWELKRG